MCTAFACKVGTVSRAIQADAVFRAGSRKTLFSGSGTSEEPDCFDIGVITPDNVLVYQRGVTLPGGPIAAAARRLDRDPVSGSQHVAFALREMRRRRGYVALTDGNLVDRTGAAAEQARRPDAAMIHQKRGFRLAAQQPDLIIDPEAAAVPPGTTRTFAQGEPVEQDR